MSRNPNRRRPTRIVIRDGLVGGLMTSLVFNGWDRALYLSVRNKTHFLSRANWQSPFQGVYQSEEFMGIVYPRMEGTPFEGYKHLMVGLLAGCGNGVILNQFANVKYHVWGREGATFYKTARFMYREGGLTPFFKGIFSTVSRDVVYGCIYETLRWRLRGSADPNSTRTHKAFFNFMSDITASSIASLGSSPLNYVRNMKFATKAAHTPPTMAEAVHRLRREVMAIDSPREKARYVSARLCLGWGTARVSLGVAFTQLIFDTMREKLGQALNT